MNQRTTTYALLCCGYLDLDAILQSLAAGPAAVITCYSGGEKTIDGEFQLLGTFAVPTETWVVFFLLNKGYFRQLLRTNGCLKRGSI